MHTFVSEDESVIIHYNSDLSGDAIVNIKGEPDSYKIPASALVEFNRNALTRAIISVIEENFC